MTGLKLPAYDCMLAYLSADARSRMARSFRDASGKRNKRRASDASGKLNPKLANVRAFKSSQGRLRVLTAARQCNVEK